MPRDEQPFLDEIHAHPYDDGPRLVYADWLEDRGDDRAEYLRLEVELNGLAEGDALFEELSPRLRELRKAIEPRWLAEVGRTQIANCLAVLLECPKRWSNLVALSDPTKRFCGNCKSFVHFCATLDQAREKAGRGECVALDSAIYRGGDSWRFADETGNVFARDDDGIIGMMMSIDE